LGVACFGLCLAGCIKSQETDRPEARVRAGWDNYRRGEYSTALKDFQYAVAHTPQKSATQLAALYGEATIWHLRRPDEDLVRAALLYRQIIECAPTSNEAAWSWLGLARIKALPIDGENSELQSQLDAYQAVIDRFPFHPAGEESFLMQQAAKLDVWDVNRTREVLAALQHFVKTHPQSPWLSAAYDLMAHCGTVLGMPDLRLDAAIQSWKNAEIDPANPIRDFSWTYWKLATIAEFEVGDFEMAREYFHKFIKESPADQKVFIAKQELKRMADLENRVQAERAVP